MLKQLNCLYKISWNVNFTTGLDIENHTLSWVPSVIPTADTSSPKNLIYSTWKNSNAGRSRRKSALAVVSHRNVPGIFACSLSFCNLLLNVSAICSRVFSSKL
jgi:hypothetical protein